VSRRILILLVICGALLALGLALIIGIFLGIIIGREDIVKTPVGEVTVEEAFTSTVIVRVSGTQGVGYSGTIGTAETGQKNIDGSLGPTPDDYEISLNTSPQSTDLVTAEVGKDPLNNSRPGTLGLQLLVDGQVVREQESSSETGVVTLSYNAEEAREEM
jgi:hypothetical protein